MPKSSRHKSHKQSKHSSKDLLSDSEEDVKVKERNNAKEVVASVRVSIESSHEKRRLSSSFQSKEAKDLSLSEEYVSSKVRKDKVERISGSGGDRWKAGGDEENGSKEMEGQKLKLDSEKCLKSREPKGLSDVKSKSSRRHESGVEEDRDVSSVLKGKEEENRSGSTRYDSKRKSDKDSSRREGRESRDTKEKEKERVSDRESKKIVEKKQESEVQVDVGSVTKKKRDSPLEDVDNDKLVKRGKENTELGVLDKSRYPESEKELEKTIHRKIEGSGGRDRYRDAKENDHKNASSKGDAAAKDGKYKDERYKAGNHREKFQDNIEKDDHRDDKYREYAGGDRDSSRRRDDKHLDGSEREHRREDRHRDDGDRDFKYRKDDEGDAQLRVDKYREDNDRENKHRDDKYHEGGKDNRRDSRYYEDGERVVGLKDEKHRVKSDRHKEEKFREDREKDNELRDGRHVDKFDKEKRVREAKYKDDRSLRDRPGDKSDTFSSELHSRKPGIHDNSTGYDDRSRLKGAQGRKRTSDKDDYIDLKPRGFKDQRYDVEKRSASDARVEIVTNRGRSGSRYADVEGRNRHSPSSSSHATRDQYRLLKQDDLKYNRENAYEERVGHNITTTREHGDNAAGVTEKNSLSRSNGVIPKDDDDVMGELSAERRMKSDTRNLISPSPTSADRRNYGRSDFRRSDDIEESVQKSSGYSQKEVRGTRDLGSETEPSSVVDENTKSVQSSHYPRNTNLLSNSRSFSHPFPSPFRSGDRHHNNNNNRRNGDPNMVVRSPWKGGLPNWPSHLANGFMPPFPHGPPPPPVGFHPAMQPFPGMRPSMELNHHHHHPYPIPDNARHVGWPTPIYDPRPPPPQLNGWEPNDSAIGGESRFFVRQQQQWHHNGPWNSKPVASLEQTFAFEKDVHNLEGPAPPSYQSNEQAKKDEQASYRSDECADVSQTSDIPKDTIPVAASEEVPVEETNDDVSKMSEKNEEVFCRAYLSVLDVSADLTYPELYSRYKDIVVNVAEEMLSDSEDDKILYVEVSKPQVGSTNEMSSVPAIGDSLLQKAMSLYNKHREGFVVKEKHSPPEKVKSPVEETPRPDSMDVDNSRDVKVNPFNEKSNEPDIVVPNDSEISSEEEKLRGNIENSVPMQTSEELTGRTEVVGSLGSLEKSEEQTLGDAKNGSMDVLNVVVSNKAKEEVVDDDVVVGELKSDESVKILHSPESTH